MNHATALAALLLALALVPAAPARAQSFGQAVAVAGDEILVGQPNIDRTPGAIFVHRRSDGGWTEVGQIVADDGIPGDRFGTDIAVDGDRMLVGAFWADSGRGAAYVFEREGDGWRQVAKLTTAERTTADSVGKQVALRGDVALVGAARTDAVHVFRRDASGAWSEAAPLPVEPYTPAGLFDGPAQTVIGFVGEAAVVGIPAADSLSGAVRIYAPTGAGWAEPVVLEAPGPKIRFGQSVAAAGDELLVGSSVANQGRGAVYVFRRQGDGWTETGTVAGPDPAPPAVEGENPSPPLFGFKIVTAGDEAWVGAPGMNGFRGTIYRLERAGDDWEIAGEVEVPEVNPGEFVGGALALGPNAAVLGMPGDDYAAGSALVFDRQGDGWAASSRLVSELAALPAVVGGEVACEGGKASRFDCGQVDLIAFVPVQDLGGERGVELNDIWGWTDPETGKEYALVGRTDGTAFVDITDPALPVFVGQLPKTEGVPGSTWRDIKVYKDHAYVVADNAGEHGVQVFDLTRLRNVENPPVVFDPDARYDRIHSAHNIAINEETGFAYSVGNGEGGDTCGGGLHMIDIRDPKSPTFAGCFSDPNTGQDKTGYTHDAQCVSYKGPDEDYAGREICFGSNETALSIADVTDKENPVPVAVAEYPNVGYTHQAWLTDDHRYLLMDDELDELNGLVDHTRTLIWDVSDLDDPVVLKEFLNPNTTSIDHNLYIVGDKVYQSNYVAGLRVLDISDIENPKEVGFFDTVPFGSDGPRFDGSWSNYPFFQSGTIAVTSGDEGLFLLRYRPAADRPIS